MKYKLSLGYRKEIRHNSHYVVEEAVTQWHLAVMWFFQVKLSTCVRQKAMWRLTRKKYHHGNENVLKNQTNRA